MNIVLTGGSGFVGYHIAKLLVSQGHSVSCAVRANSHADALRALGITLFEADLSRLHEAPLIPVLTGADAVIHSAAITRATSPEEFTHINCEATLTLARAAAKAGVKRFVFISSLAARGPDAASQDGLDRPSSPYGQSKLDAEQGLKALEDEISCVALRLAGVYGPRDRDLLPLFQMAQKGLLITPRRGALQPLYVSDAAHATVAAAIKPDAPFGPHTLAETGVYTWRKMATLMQEALARPVRHFAVPSAVFHTAAFLSEQSAKLTGHAPQLDRRRAQDLSVHSWTCDPHPAEHALNWQAHTPLATGLMESVAWYKQHNWL